MKGIQLKRFIPIIIIIVLMVIAFSLGFGKYFTVENLTAHHQAVKDYVALHSFWSPLIFMVVYLVAIALSIPGGALLSLIGGFLFGVPVGTIYVLIGATFGATLIFLAARSAFSEILRKRAGPFLKKMEKGFHENKISYLLFLRFIPLFPFWLVNIAPAFFRVPLLTYVWTTLVGIIPGSFAYTQAGTGISAILEGDEPLSLEAIFNPKMRIALIVLALVSLGPILVKKCFLKKE